MCGAAAPATTVTDSKQVLAELVTIPGNGIPAALLAEAEGIAIIPRVLKVGLFAGVRRGHGVVLVRDASGNWGLPRFITLTGGSLGWQVGVQGTDVVLVFTTARSVTGLLDGKFTVGVDAAAAAGPVGRNVAAATDTSLRAEILSYSRSRGLFVGASVDGSVIEMNDAAQLAFYGASEPNQPQTVPVSAVDLQSFVTQLTGGQRIAAVAPVVPLDGVAPASATGAASAGVASAVAVSPQRVEELRQSLLAASSQLSQLLSEQWVQYLALPGELIDPGAQPDLTALEAALARFEEVASGDKFRELANRPEFQTTRSLLREYVNACRGVAPTLVLPAPPATQALTR